MTIFSTRDSNSEKIIQMNLFYALGKLLSPNTISDQEIIALKLWKKWESPILELKDLVKFQKITGVSLQLWQIRIKNRVLHANRIARYRNTPYLDVVLPSTFDNSQDQQLLLDEIRVCFDKTYFDRFVCKEKDCNYMAPRSSLMSDHEIAHQKECIKYKKVLFGKYKDDDLLRSICLPKDFVCKNVVMYDIEALMRTEGPLKVHVPVMVCLKNNFHDENSHIIKRFDMSGDGYKMFIQEFLEKLLEWSVAHRNSLPKQLHSFIAAMETKIKDPNLNTNTLMSCRKKLNAAKKILVLKVMGFNAQKYDILALSSALIDICISQFGKDSINAVKKGSGFFILDIAAGENNLSFRDVMSYITPQTLDSFGKSWGAKVSKLSWPYELYSNLDEIKETIKFPDYTLFTSSLLQTKKNQTKFLVELEEVLENQRRQLKCDLKLGHLMTCMGMKYDFGDEVFNSVIIANKDERLKVEASLHISPEVYADSKISYESYIESGESSNLLDYFEWYNEIDVEILLDAWEKMFDMFHKTFQLNLLNSWSLPGVAQNIMLNMYPQNIPPVYTFDDAFGFLNKEIRKNLVGGFSGPLTKR
jgi:hypothetical protein